MKYYQNLPLIVPVLLLFTGCNNMNSKTANESFAASDSVSSAFTSSSATHSTSGDSSRKFIRTIDMKFSVNNVLQSTYNIENITRKQNGFVIYTDLTSDVDNVTVTPVSSDSSVETTFYTVKNSVTLRVPNAQLDTTLKEISANIDYLDQRTIKADDVALQILANDLTQSRLSLSAKHIHTVIEKKNNRLAETTMAEAAVANNLETSDEAKVANLSLYDQVNFSTIHLMLYQRQAIKRTMIPNYKDLSAYEPGLGIKILESLHWGWIALETIFLFAIKFWALIIISVILYYLYQKFIKPSATKV